VADDDVKGVVTPPLAVDVDEGDWFSVAEEAVPDVLWVMKGVMLGTEVWVVGNDEGKRLAAELSPLVVVDNEAGPVRERESVLDDAVVEIVAEELREDEDEVVGIADA